MKILVSGSAGHLGEALMRTLQAAGHDAIGLDVLASPFTTEVGSIVDRSVVSRCMTGVDAVLHAATLHKPHVATHTRQQFIDTNITGTLNLLEEAASAGVGSFVFTSTTSTFGDALTPPVDGPALWVTEDIVPLQKNIYGVTKVAAENLCELFHRNAGMPCIVLRTSRFFPEDDDNKATLRRRQSRPTKCSIGAPISRTSSARISWPCFAFVIERLQESEDFRSPLAHAVGSKGYHREVFPGVPFPT